MTTNVYDVPAGLLTSDSRWSCELDDGWIAYVDNSGYDKIVYDNQLAILFAGNLAKIDHWKNWFTKNRNGDQPQEVDGISLIVANIKTGEVIFKTDYLLESTSEKQIDALYSGTGGPYAKDCWQINKCAKKAVETAISVDIFSGGDVSFLHRESSETNVKNSVFADEVMALMKERGILMNKNLQQAVAIKDAANDSSDPNFQRMAQRVLSGNIELNAPFPGMDQPWTNEKKAELRNVLSSFSVGQ